MKKKLTIGLSVMAIALAGAAVAEPGRGPGMGYMGQKSDANGDGIVTRAESEAHAEKMFAFMDANKDGKLDETDREARRTERRTKMFDMLDTDKDGQISRAEFMAKPAGGPDGPGWDGKRGYRGKMRGHHGHGMMMGRMADTDKDGTISKAEFLAAAKARFDKVDANSDGKITKEEHQAARKAMRDKAGPGMGRGPAPDAPGNAMRERGGTGA